MSDPTPEAKKTVSVVYTLFLIGLAVQAAMLAAAAVAVAKRPDIDDPLLRGHLDWLLWTFAIAAPVIGVAAYLTFGMGITGAAWAFAIWIWVIYRAVKGAIRFWKNQASGTF
jgi:uncharacterized membrane protein